MSFIIYICVCGGYLFPLQHVVKPGLSGNLFHKLFGESGQWEHGLSQGILGDLTEEEGLVFAEICCFEQPHRWQGGKKRLLRQLEG